MPDAGPPAARAARRIALGLLALALAPLAASCGARSARVEAVPAEAPARDTAPRDAREEAVAAAPEVHVVAPGETMWRIARRYGVTVDELAAANGISDPTSIRAGRELVVPRGGPAGPARGATTLRDDLSVPSRRPGWAWPVDGRVSSRFGAPRSRGSHKGIDILVPNGTPVMAVRDGRVRYSGRRGAYGKLVVLEHDDGYASWYAHNSANLVRTGQRVRRGDVIARSGATGNATAPHVHFELRREDRPIDPLAFLPLR